MHFIIYQFVSTQALIQIYSNKYVPEYIQKESCIITLLQQQFALNLTIPVSVCRALNYIILQRKKIIVVALTVFIISIRLTRLFFWIWTDCMGNALKAAQKTSIQIYLEWTFMSWETPVHSVLCVIFFNSRNNVYLIGLLIMNKKSCQLKIICQNHVKIIFTYSFQNVSSILCHHQRPDFQHLLYKCVNDYTQRPGYLNLKQTAASVM